MDVINTKMFHICKDFFFLMRNSQVTASCFMEGFALMSGTFPLIQNSYLSKMVESDLLEITSFLISNARMVSWHYLYSIFRKK